MAYFKWVGVDSTGRKTRGGIMAVDKNDAIVKLKSRRINIKKIQQTQPQLFSFFSKKVSEKELLITTRQLAIMIRAGLPIDESLNIVAEQITNPYLAEIIYDVKKRIEAGSTFANALRAHRNVFSNLYINMIDSAEKSGKLEDVLMRLTNMMEKSIALKRKIRGAMIYPATVSAVAVVVVTIILTFVIPTFATLYRASKLPLPLPTRIVIEVSKFLQHTILYFVLFIVAIAFIVRYFYRNNEGFKRAVDALMLRLPVIGMLLRKSSIANFSNILASLTASGVEILESLEIAARTAGNTIIEEALYVIKDEVKRGENLSVAMIRSAEFPSMVTQMVAVGEESGNLEEMLNNVSRYYDEEVDNLVKNLTTLMEPVIIVVLGGIIGFIVVSMYLPIFELGNVVH